MRTLVLLLLLAGCVEATSNDPRPEEAFNVGVRATNVTCSFEMYSPVGFTATVVVGEEKRDTLVHVPGRFPLGWRMYAGATTVFSAPGDSIDVPGGFTFTC
jgi:hypothetical protein